MGEKVQKPGSMKGTRSASHLHRALEVFLKNFKVIHSLALSWTSRTEMKERTKKILKEQQKYVTVLFINFMVDVFECISQLSSLSQREDITLTGAKNGLQRTVLELTVMLARPGTHLQQDANEYHGVILKKDADDLAQFNNASKPRIINYIIKY